MTPHPWDDDEMLLGDVRDALTVGADLQTSVAEAGYSVYAWRTVDQDLATLAFDSSERPAIVRAQDRPTRVLTFTSAVLSLELEVTAGQVSGQILPPGSGRILAETTDGTTFHVDTDEVGFFRLPEVLGYGPVRLRCDTPTSRLVTDWIGL